MQTILITGGTGLIGRHLTRLLVAKGYNVIILTRHPPEQNSKSVSYAAWDIKNKSIDIDALQRADAIVHLAGAAVVEHKWTDSYKKEILESRTESSALLVSALATNSNKVKSIISASAIGWYGKDFEPGYSFTETDKAAPDFLGQTCFKWEHSLDAAEQAGIRVCKLRTGIVLSNEGGALTEFNKPLRFGIAAILSNGRQVISWIHIEDLCRMYMYAIENASLAGPYNAVAPRPVSNRELTIRLATNQRGKAFIPIHVPSLVLKLMMGERSIEVLKSATVSASRIKEAGFTFLYPSVEAALGNLYQK